MKLIGFLFCSTLALAASAQNTYQQEIANWHAKRIVALKAPNGWLNLVGLYWLNEGQNTFGSDSSNKTVFPKGSIAAKAGVFERSGSTIKLIVAKNATITVNGKPVKEAIIYSDESSQPPVVASGDLRWTVIKREDKIGIRLRDLQSPTAANFKDIDRFPVDTTWRITATLQTTAQPGQIAITNVLGQTSQQQTPGKLAFTINGRQYTLDALEEDGALFIVFGDETSGKTTYPSGRFLTVKKPDANGTTIIDFNEAYNPPCAFTPYATCPLPPRQNILPIPVTAGEETYGHH